MFNLILIPHKEVSDEQLWDIIGIKSVAWHYSFKKQVEWIRDNLNDRDIHVLLSLDGRNVSYLNLIEINVKIDGVIKVGYGIGNVCTIEKGKGWGSEIIVLVNLYLKRKNKVGLLFCKDSLVGFYRLNDWELVGKDKGGVINIMVYNYGNKFNRLEYSGKLF